MANKLIDYHTPEKITRRFESLKTQKAAILEDLRVIDKYVNARETAGDEMSLIKLVNRELFDSTARKANKLMASIIVGMLWSGATRSIRLEPPEELPDNQANREYYDFVTREMARTMDDPRSGFSMAMNEYMKDQGSYGTSGLYSEEAPDDDPIDVLFQAWGLKSLVINEGSNGFVDTVYREFEWPINKAVKEYGLDNLSDENKDKFLNNHGHEKMRILHAIEPRVGRTSDDPSNQNMPWASIHFESKSKKILRTSGFAEIPVKIARFDKMSEDLYGRSPAMDALSDILELDGIWESLTLAIEKNLDPPIVVLDDGRLGADKIDTSPKAINVFRITGRIGNQPPVSPMFTVGEMKSTQELVTVLVDSIMQHFLIDRLLDLNNETQMTLGEAQIRNSIRGTLLGSVFDRQITEMLTPTIQRTFNIKLKRGSLGVIRGSEDEQILIAKGKQPVYIPDDVAKLILDGKDVYRIAYFTPAMRMLRAEQAQGILQTWNFVKDVSQGKPSAMDNFDEDKAVREVAEIAGAPAKILKDFKSMIKERQMRTQMVEQQEQTAQLEQAANIAQVATKAAANVT